MVFLSNSNYIFYYLGHNHVGSNVIFYSDRGEFVKDSADRMYQQMYEADYMINIAALKSHIRAGITLFGKTHFGSHTELGASHLHPGLVSPGDNGAGENQGYGIYRVLVDLLGHEHLGGKTVINILDGLWGGSEHELYRPRKWNMAPYNDDYTSSIFASFAPELRSRHTLISEPTVPPIFTNGSITIQPSN